jgi:hypothetical protein
LVCSWERVEHAHADAATTKTRRRSPERVRVIIAAGILGGCSITPWL